jgi:hypothetical protein
LRKNIRLSFQNRTKSESWFVYLLVTSNPKTTNSATMNRQKMIYNPTLQQKQKRSNAIQQANAQLLHICFYPNAQPQFMTSSQK